MRLKISIALALLLVGVNAGWKAPGSHAQAARLALDSAGDFAVEFSDCVESIGVTLVPTDRARAYLPAPFILVGEGQPVTPLVVRTARCRGVAVNGHAPKTGEIVQIGLVIVPPDGTGDINNYTLWYDSSDARLATQLGKLGVSAELVATMVYDFDADGHSLFVRVSRPGSPGLALFGTVQPSPDPAGSFLANWWQQTSAGNVKMSTSVPVINIGGADLTLATDPDGPLGQLIGGGSTGFVVLQQFNTFASAHMEVSAVSP
jgi:hypothetical protein